MFGWWLVLAGGGCSCRQLPDPTDPDKETTEETSHTATESGHSAVPQGPCPQPEVEPNDAIDASQPLELERGACGVVDEVNDLDYWGFELEDDAWLQIEVQAGPGSIANVTALVSPEGGGWAASRSDDPESLDATFRFPAPAGSYTVVVSEQNFQGGERYGYSLLVSESKSPIEYDREEVEPNDANGAAETLASGDSVFGTMDGNGALPDLDWYRVVIPAGKHTLSFDVTAFDEGSAADLTVYLYDQALEGLPEGCREVCPPGSSSCVECGFAGGIVGLELDPAGQYLSDGNEIVYLLVSDPLGRESPAGWYLLNVILEGA